MLTIDYFPLIGPSRHSDALVVEISVMFGAQGGDGFPPQLAPVMRLLVHAGILSAGEEFLLEPLPADRKLWCASLLLQTALLFQRKTGHGVEFFNCLETDDPDRLLALLEYQHCDVGMTAVKLAYEFLSGQRKMLAQPFQMFETFARERLFPLESTAIAEVAAQRNIPCIKLEQQPFKREDFNELTDGDCIRRNALLMLGHGSHQQVLDGTFCLTKSAKFRYLLKDRSIRQGFLKELNDPGLEVSGPDLQRQQSCALFAVAGKVIMAIDSDGLVRLPETIQSTWVEAAIAVNVAVEYAPVLVFLEADNKTRKAGGVSIDFDLAPRLDELLSGDHKNGPDALKSAATALVDWLLPRGHRARMPSIAVTGTNGKTTTTRLISHILMAAGKKTGMVCTDGIFIDGKKIKEGDLGTAIGHLEVLTHRDAEMAVLETHHKGILQRGFAFDYCDIGICLNVTEDHLGIGHIHSVEQMARVKQAVPQRARKAAILNADDPHCLGMINDMTAKIICLVSMQQDLDQLRAHTGSRVDCFCLLELMDDHEWIVIYHQGHRLPLMDVATIPITFGGTARFNISNVMHASMACFLLDIGLDIIKSSLRQFKPGLESTPGRMNVFDNLPFRVVMDFAHNPDGIFRLTEFVNAQAVKGRKILACSGASDRRDETLKNIGRVVAGHYDFYFCKEYPSAEKEERRPVAHIVQAGLLERGVQQKQTTVRTHGKDVIFEIFDFCKPGDLLVVMAGHVEKNLLPGYISEYAEKLQSGASNN